MRIGIYINNKVDIINGGSDTYLSRLLGIIDNFEFQKSLQFVFIFRYNETYNFKKEKIILTPVLKEYYHGKNKRSIFNKFKRKCVNNESEVIENHLKKNKIDIIYYPIGESIVLNYPYVITSWDIGHRSTYSFPELAMNNTFEDRNYYTKNALLKSFAIFVESNASKKELISYLGVFEKKIFVLPLFPGEVIFEKNDCQFTSNFLITNKIEPNKFFFYPAQFWAHKNHFGLIQAFIKFHKIHPEIKLVFCGSDKGNLDYIIDEIERNNMTHSILNLGFVSNKELCVLYENCIALVYPSFFGPSNMPPLEAMALNCKVACSNLEGHIESLGDKAIYFDPTNFDAIFDAMVKIFLLPKLNQFQFEPDNYYASLIETYFLKILPIRKSFGLNFIQF